MSDRNEKIRLQTKKRRDEYQALGLCPICGNPNDRHPKFHCTSCNEKHKIRAHEWRVKKAVNLICAVCGATLTEPSWTCPSCKEKVTQKIKDMRNKRLEQGLCLGCGQKNDNPYGYQHCDPCRDKRKQKRKLQKTE